MAFGPKQYAQDQKYIKANIKLVHVSLNRKKPEDMEMLMWLESQDESASSYIKRLIKQDMNRGKKQK